MLGNGNVAHAREEALNCPNGKVDLNVTPFL
jgi:hypothetical protein